MKRTLALIRANNALVQTFSVNNLNQLTTGTRSGNMTVAGGTTADATSVTVADNGNSAVAAIRYADRTFARTNVTLVNGNNTFAAVAQDSLGRYDTNTVAVSLPSTAGYLYDLNGNLRTNGTTVLTYDDENQLTHVVVSNVTKSEFTYDGKMRRRVRKESLWANAAWRQVIEVRYVYDGNLVLQERHFESQLGTTLPQRAVSYTRGLDLSGSLQGAGGIGGLLARTELSTFNPQLSTHAYYHSDANGNVTAMVDAGQQVVARYLYDPFGGLLASSGPLAEVNCYRFSGKEFDAASGLVYYLYRCYEPQLQRWVNRDPAGEAGGINLYCWVWNAPLMWVDPYGLNNICVSENCKGVDLSDYTYLAEDEPNGALKVLRSLPVPGQCVDADAIHTPGEAFKIGDSAQVYVDCKDGTVKLYWGGFDSKGNKACWKFGRPNPPVLNWPQANQPIPPYEKKPPVKPQPPLKPFPSPKAPGPGPKI